MSVGVENERNFTIYFLEYNIDKARDAMLYSIHIQDLNRRLRQFHLTIFRKDANCMTLWDELYFEITLQGSKSELKKFVSFLKSGELEDFFEVTSEYIIYGDNYAASDDSAETEIIFTNDDYGIEIEELDTDEFLEILCKAAKGLDVYGTLSDGADGEFQFTSAKDCSYYINSRKSMRFNDELDEVARDEEDGESN